MENKVKVVQFGTGKMAKYTMRYVYEKGGEVVGAIDVNPAVIGKDIGEIIGCENKNVKVTSFEDAEAFLEDCMAVVCKNIKEVRDYFDDAGMDVAGMSEEELLEASEVFAILDGRFLVVEG